VSYEEIKTSINIPNIEIKDNAIDLNGIVLKKSKKEKNSINVNLKGELYKNYKYSNAFVGNLYDSNKLVDVIYFNVFKYDDFVEKQSLLTKLNIKTGDIVLQLFARDNKTGDFLIIEDVVKEEEPFEEALSNVNKFEVADVGLLAWQPRILKPLKVESNVLVDTNGVGDNGDISQYTIEDESLIGTLALDLGDNGQDIDTSGTDKKYFYYAETYDVAGETVTYLIKGRAQVTAPNLVNGGSARVENSISIQDKWTESSVPFYEDDDSPFGLGTYSNEVEGITTISSEDYFSTLAASRSDAYKKTFGTFSLNFGIGLNDYLSLGWSADIWDLLGMSTNSVGTTALGPIIESEDSTKDETDCTKVVFKQTDTLLGLEQAQYVYETQLQATDTGSKYVKTQWDFVISAKYDGSFSWNEASIPNERDFSFTIYDWYTVY